MGDDVSGRYGRIGKRSLLAALAALACCHATVGVASASDAAESAPFAPEAVTFAGDEFAWAEVFGEARKIVVYSTAGGGLRVENLELPLLRFDEGDAFISVLTGRPGTVAMQAGVDEFEDLGFKQGTASSPYFQQFESTGSGFVAINAPCRNVERGGGVRMDMTDQWIVREAPDCGFVQARHRESGRIVELPFTGAVQTGGDWFFGLQYRLSSPGGSDLLLADANGAEVARIPHAELGGTLVSFDVGANGLGVAVVRSTPEGALNRPQEHVNTVVTLSPDGQARRFVLPEDTATAEVRSGDALPVLLRTTHDADRRSVFREDGVRALDATIEVLDPASGRRRVIGRDVIDLGAVFSGRPRSFDARGDEVLWVERACGEVRFVRRSVHAATIEDEGSFACPLELNARPRKRSDRVTVTTSCRGLPRSCSLVGPEVRSVGRNPFTVARVVPDDPDAGIALTQRGERLGRGKRTVRVRVRGRMQSYGNRTSDYTRVSRVVDMVIPR